MPRLDSFKASFDRASKSSERDWFYRPSHRNRSKEIRFTDLATEHVQVPLVL